MKRLHDMLSFARVILFGEHMNNPMRCLQDVMSIPIFYWIAASMVTRTVVEVFFFAHSFQ